MNDRDFKKKLYLYEKIVEDISNQINNGVLKSGEQLPSLRKLSRDFRVSISTVMQAYTMLESLGLVIVKSKSGYYVRHKTDRVLPEIEITNIETTVKRFQPNEIILSIQDLARTPNIISLGAAIPHSDVLPVKKLSRIVTKISRGFEPTSLDYQFPPGNYKLRREIAKHSIEWGCNFSPDDIIITSGAMDAISLCLRAIAKHGDTIIIESPNYTVNLLLLQSLGLKILELPTHPRDGINIPSLKRVLEDHEVAGCLLYPTLCNPIGSIMPLKKREEVYKILAYKEIPLIEVNVHGELCFDHSRPKPIKALDIKKNVLYIYSFSKTVAPGYRIGWVSPGRYYEQVRRLKLINSMATASIQQMAIAEFLKSGGFERSIKNQREIFSNRVSVLSDFVSEYFPDGTRFSRPRGGYFLWVELPKNADSVKLQRMALKENISIAPGPMFTTKERNYRNFIRLSCATPNWSSSTIQSALEKLGKLIRQF